MDTRIVLGLERAIDQSPIVMRGRRLGLVMNQASVTADMTTACEAIARAYPGQLQVIFSPQHGIWGEQQANMIETAHSVYEPLQLPVYSLYSETRRPAPGMLDDLDCLVVDLQDVGTRVYTFIWTMLECLRACAESGKTIVVLDRPNPIGGEILEGPVLASNLKSFVGGHEIPLRHALTIGELAQLLVAECQLDVELVVVPMLGWERQMQFPETGLRWQWPSPNMPAVTTALVYPGQVLLEGTNLSEGRGTTRPFEVVGAPFLDPWQWMPELERFPLPGLKLRPIRFVPTFDKWMGESCGGIDLQIIEPSDVRSVGTTLALLATAAKLAPDQFRWLPPPYEYEMVKPPIDILFGAAALREQIDQSRDRSLSPNDIEALLHCDENAWLERATPHQIYR